MKSKFGPDVAETVAGIVLAIVLAIVVLAIIAGLVLVGSLMVCWLGGYTWSWNVYGIFVVVFLLAYLAASLAK